MSEEFSIPKVFFHEEFGSVRTLGDWENPQFCLADVCRILELPQVAKVVQRLDKEVLTTHPLQTAGGIQSFYFVNEDGLYDVILDSRKPSAKKFRKWITKEVLPTLRKTGTYSMPGNDNDRIIIVNFGGGNSVMSDESSDKWIKEKSGEGLIRAAKLLGEKGLTAQQKWVLGEAIKNLSGKDLPE